MIRRKATDPLSARRDRSAEFQAFVPRPRAPAPATALPALLRTAELDPPPRFSSAAARRHMGRVASLGCVLCRQLGYGATPAQVHHLRTGIGKGQRASDYLTMPLCEAHHTGAAGIHGDRSALRQAGVSEIDLLALTIAMIVNGDAR